jgi:hypothetical protein
VRHRPRHSLLVAGCALGLGWSASVYAADDPSWLSWSAPVECQNTPEVERRLEFLLGRAVDFSTLPPTNVRMGWSVEHGWAVRVTVALPEGPRDRSLDAPSCADAFDLVALSMALILDPDFRAAEEDPAASSRDPVEVNASAEPAVASDIVVGLSPAAPVAALPPPDRPGPEGDGAKRAPASRTLLSAAAGALTDINTFPVPEFGGALQVALARGGFRVELEGALLASESTRLGRAQFPVTFSSFSGGVRGCYELELGDRFTWVGCLGAELGRIGTHEQGGEGVRTRGSWLAARALTGPEFAATSWLRAFARIRAGSTSVLAVGGGAGPRAPLGQCSSAGGNRDGRDGFRVGRTLRAWPVRTCPSHWPHQLYPLECNLWNLGMFSGSTSTSSGVPCAPSG